MRSIKDYKVVIRLQEGDQGTAQKCLDAEEFLAQGRTDMESWSRASSTAALLVSSNFVSIIPSDWALYPLAWPLFSDMDAVDRIETRVGVGGKAGLSFTSSSSGLLLLKFSFYTFG